jgi:rhodanese-related sulfurtransferase
MDPEEVARRLDAVQVVDVRYPNEWEAGHLEGSVHIQQDYLYERLDDLDRSRAVVTVCRSGDRSTAAAEELAGEGFEASSMDGGLEAWAAQGRPLVAADGSPGSVVEPEPPADDRSEAMQQLQADFVEAALAVQAHFGDREPTEEEVLAFLRARDAAREG